jgi:hypothetical protein
MILEEFEQITQITVRAKKFVFADAKHVSVEITRAR